MITSAQLRAARALLRWTAEDLSEKSGIGVATIRRFELSTGVPSVNLKTIQSLISAVQSAGVEFIGQAEDGEGVRFAPKRR